MSEWGRPAPMTFGAPRTTPPRRLVVALGAWVAAVPLVGALALAARTGAQPPASVVAAGAEGRDVLLVAGSATDAVVIELTAPTSTTSPPTTSPPTTSPPATSPPTTAPQAPAAAPVPRPAPAPAAPPTTEAPPPPPVAGTPAGVDAAAEQQLLDDHNRRRAAHGLPPLQRHGCLDAVARDWAAGMAASQQLRHNPAYADAVDACIAWTSVGENVGFSGTVADLAERFWASPEHRANVLGAYQYVGVGVVVDAAGVRWATLEFAAA